MQLHIDDETALKRIIGRNIRRVLHEQKRTQTSLAQQIGSTRESIGQSIAGKSAISLRRVCEIAAAMDVPVTDLLLDDDDRESLKIGRMMRNDFIMYDCISTIAHLDDDTLHHLQKLLHKIR